MLLFSSLSMVRLLPGGGTEEGAAGMSVSSAERTNSAAEHA